MMKRKSLYYSFFVIIFSLVFGAIPAQALQAGDVVMSLSPPSQDLELTTGQTTKGSITVTNSGRIAFDVRPTVVPYRVANNDYLPDFSTDTSYTRLHNWIKLAKDSYHINPGEKVEIDFTVTVPEDVAAGGQYAAILLQGDYDSDEQAAIKVNAQLAAVLYGHINGANIRAEGELVGHSLPSFMFNRAFAVSQTVNNPGNIDFKVTQKLTITNVLTNQEVINPSSVSPDGQALGYNVSTVLPKTTRTGILTWEDAPRLGLFRITQEISFLDQNYTFSGLVFICPIWLVIIVVAAIIALIIWGIYRFKQARHSRKPANLL